MAALENYKKLGTVGTAYKGEYQSGQKYKYANTVYFKGSTYIALKDDPEGEPTDDGINWKYFAKGMDGGAIPEKEKGVPNGVATLDENGKITEEQLPDDIGVDLAVVSDKFSTDKDYAAGEYCIYEDVLYKFTSPKEPGEWDEAVVEATNVVTELASLNSNLIDNLELSYISIIDGESNTVDMTDVKYFALCLYNSKGGIMTNMSPIISINTAKMMYRAIHQVANGSEIATLEFTERSTFATATFSVTGGSGAYLWIWK